METRHAVARPERAGRRAAALHRPVPRARCARAGRARALLLRARRHQDGQRRRPHRRLCRRVAQGPLRLGIQAPRPQPGRSAQATDDVRAAAGKPAAAGGVRPRQPGGAHALHRHAQRAPRVRAGPAHRSGPAAAPAHPVDGARGLAAPLEQPRDHRAGRAHLCRHRRAAARRGRAGRGGEPLPHAVCVLLLCRRRGPAARAPFRAADARARGRGADGGAAVQPAGHHARRWPVRRGQRALVQWRPVCRRQRAAAGRGRHRRLAHRQHAGLERHRPQHLRHPVRARARSCQARAARRALHRPRHHRAAGGAGGHAPAAGRVGRRARPPARGCGRGAGQEQETRRQGLAAGAGRLRGLSGAAEALPRARPRLRQRQLPVPGAEGAEGRGAPGQPGGRGAGPGAPDRRHGPAQRAGHRDQRIRRRAGAGDGVDRRAAMARAARLPLQAGPGAGAAGPHRVPRCGAEPLRSG